MTTPLAASLTPLAIVQQHLGHLGAWTEQPGRIAWRCRDPQCPGYNRVIDLSVVFGLVPGSARPSASDEAGSTSTSRSRGIPKLNDPDACGIHTGEWADSCGRCRADVIGIDPEHERDVTRPAGAPPSPEYLAARAALREKSTR
jgi:hypothetical protein